MDDKETTYIAVGLIALLLLSQKQPQRKPSPRLAGDGTNTGGMTAAQIAQAAQQNQQNLQWAQFAATSVTALGKSIAQIVDGISTSDSSSTDTSSTDDTSGGSYTDGENASLGSEYSE